MTTSTAWTVSVALLCGLGLVGIAAWALATHDQHGLRWVAPVVVLSGLVVIGALRPLAAGASRLRWDGAAWHLRSSTAPLDDAGPAGELRVALDFGGWMLVRFITGSGWRRRVAWLALGRRAQPAQWHALRCAILAARRTPDTP